MLKDKYSYMQKSLKVLAVILLVTAVSIGCGKSTKEKKGETGDLKVELAKKVKEKADLDAEIRKLEEKIAKADPKSAEQARKLVAVDTLRTQDFIHFIELQG